MSLHRHRTALLPTGLLLLLLTACSGAAAGTAQLPLGTPPASVIAGTAPPGSGSGLGSEPSDSGLRSISHAQIRYGPPGLPSPTGEVVLRRDGDLVCFVPATAAVGVLAGDVGTCAGLVDGEEPHFADFSPDGGTLLYVAGPDEHRNAIYLIDSATAQVRVVGPDGIEMPSAAPPRWDLSGIIWSVDGSSLVLVPRTDTADGAVLAADPRAGGVTELGRLPAEVANGTPNLWSTGQGLAVVATTGPDRRSLWWLPADRTSPVDLGQLAEPGGAMRLIAADPAGQTVLVCPSDADGRLGRMVAVDVASGHSTPVLSDTDSCPGAAFAPDGGIAALTATVAGGYSLLLVDVRSGERLLTVPLPVPEPASPPYLTWTGSTVVALDRTGEWLAPSLIIGLR